MRALGITVEETAFVYTILPFAAVLGSPIAGFIGDYLLITYYLLFTMIIYLWWLFTATYS